MPKKRARVHAAAFIALGDRGESVPGKSQASRCLQGLARIRKSYHGFSSGKILLAKNLDLLFAYPNERSPAKANGTPVPGMLFQHVFLHVCIC